MLRTLKEFFWISFRAEFFNIPQMLSQSVFFVLILMVFNFLWIEGGKGQMRMPASPADMLWYLVLTETVALSVTVVYREIESDFRRGRMASALLRPTHYLWIIFWQGAGTFCARLPVFAAVGGATGAILTGGWPTHTGSALAALLVAPFACGVLMIFIVSVGLSTVWLRDCAPVWWVFQKCLFVFGGLMLPVSMYPDWFQAIAAVLPFKRVLDGVAQGVLGGPAQAFCWNLMLLSVWLLVGIALARWLHGMFVKKVLRGEV